MIRQVILILSCMLTIIICSACTHSVAVTEPVTINLNVKIDHEIRHKIDKDLDEVLSADNGLF